MQLHGNAALSVKKRLLLCERVVDQGWTLTKAAAAAEVSVRTAGKWARRYQAEGAPGLLDRSSSPHRQPTRTEEARVQAIAALRRLRMTGAQIAEVLQMPLSTVSGILQRIGLGKLSRLEPPEPPNRYERRQAGELIHIDVKKLGRIERGAGHRVTGKRLRGNPRKTNAAGRVERQVGWEYVHIAIDDATRLAYVVVLADEKATTAVGFLRRALAFYRRHSIRVERVMTDNGAAYVSLAHAVACRALQIRHLRTRPYRPRTNGKAERFIRTMLAEWAYGAIYRDSDQRTTALAVWLEHYNYRRPHGALSHQPPVSRLRQLTGNNLLGSYT
jgi:transposase InsO family protein